MCVFGVVVYADVCVCVCVCVCVFVCVYYVWHPAHCTLP